MRRVICYFRCGETCIMMGLAVANTARYCCCYCCYFLHLLHLLLLLLLLPARCSPPPPPREGFWQKFCLLSSVVCRSPLSPRQSPESPAATPPQLPTANGAVLRTPAATPSPTAPCTAASSSLVVIGHGRCSGSGSPSGNNHRPGACRAPSLYLGAPGRCPPWSQAGHSGARGACSAARPPPTAAGGWYKHLKGGLPVLGVRFGGLKAVKVCLPPRACSQARFWVSHAGRRE
jgi:hypothetical protein